MRYAISGWLWWRPVLRVMGRIFVQLICLGLLGVVGALLLVLFFNLIGF